MKTAALLLSAVLPSLLIAQGVKSNATKQSASVHPALAAQAEGQRSLAPTKQVIDLGSIKSTVPQKITITLRNTGNAPVQLTSVTPTCGCTTVDHMQANKSVAPGESHSIDFVFNPTGLNGQVTKTIHLQTSESDKPLDVKIQATVTSLALLQPNYIVIDAQEDGDKVTAPFRLVPTTKGLDPLGIEAEDKDLPISSTYEKAVGGEVKGFITFNPKAYKSKAGNNLGQQRTLLTYRDKSGETEVMNVIWSVRPIYWSAPQQIKYKLRPMDSVEPFSRFFIVADRPVKVTSIEVSLPGVKAVVAAAMQTDPPTLSRFTLEGSLPAGTYQGEIVIHTDHPKRPVFKVPYQIEVK